MWPGISSILSYGLQFVKFLTGGLDLKINVSYAITTVKFLSARASASASKDLICCPCPYPYPCPCPCCRH